jgi:D-tyrosyl-tRNA(Tyr) deacylase
MIALIQRVSEASVTVNAVRIGEIRRGILALIGYVQGDGEAQNDRMLDRILSYRIFPDEEGRMNRSLVDIEGGLLLVPQFTLAANTKKGTRASFTRAAEPDLGKSLFQSLAGKASAAHAVVATGQFGADMKVGLVNDGPVTFWLES